MTKSALPTAPPPPQPWRTTPLFESTALSRVAGCRILLKLETQQPSGSFKSRGIGYLLLSALARSAHPERVHFYCSSGGNAGLACVHAAAALGRPATVVVPLLTKPHMVRKLREAGASEVVQFGKVWVEADRYMREVIMVEGKKGREERMKGGGAYNGGTNGEVKVVVAEVEQEEVDEEEEAIYAPPFDHPDVWTGNSTLLEELTLQLPSLSPHPPTAIICSVGGGGLLNGIAQGMLLPQNKAWAQQTTLLAVETQGADSLAASLAAGKLVTIPAMTSRAISLGATTVCQRTFDLASRASATTSASREEGGEEMLKVRSVVLTDMEAAQACVELADRERMLVELACGVNVAMCFNRRLEKALEREIGREECVVVVLCGGSDVNAGMIERWREECQMGVVKHED